MNMSDYGLDKRALLVKVVVPTAKSKRKSEVLSKELSENANASEDMISAVVEIMPKEFVAQLSQIGRTIKKAHERFSASWEPTWRITTTELMDKHSEAMESLVPLFNKEALQLVENLPAAIAAARLRLGSAFDEKMYPTQEQLREQLKVTIKYRPIPASNDFRLQIDSDSLEFLRAKLEEDVKDSVYEAMRSLRERMLSGVKTFIERLEKVENYRDPKTAKMKAKGHVHSTITTNLLGIIEIVPKLNLTGDPDIDDLALKLKKQLCSFDKDTLNLDQRVREDVIRQAKQLLTELSK